MQNTETNKQTVSIEKDRSALEDAIENTFHINVYGTSETISISIEDVRNLIANPTKSGKLPCDKDIIQFAQLCKARGLNPWQGDAYLVGYDTKDGPKFETITSHQALLKRATNTAGYHGKKSGVIVIADGKLRRVNGDVYDDAYKLVGGWCRVYMEDRMPEFQTAKLSAYDKGFGQWNIDKSSMIRKCAEAKALRAACPQDTAGMIIHEELNLDTVIKTTEKKRRKTLEEIQPPSLYSECVTIDQCRDLYDRNVSRGLTPSQAKKNDEAFAARCDEIGG